ncbi:MAG: ATP-binding protein [Deltaproteobacteria bacterium]|nr:ATP-binding protein [Deltaproteobacteria bacterium]
MNNEQLTASFNPFAANAFTGTVIRVSGASLKLVLCAGSRSGSQPTFCSSSVGDYIVVEHDDLALVGQISEISVSSEDVAPLPETSPESGKFPVCATAELLASVELSNGRVSPGVLAYPRIGAAAYNAHPLLVQMVVESRCSIDSGQEVLTLTVGRLHDQHQTVISITPEKLFGRHCAVVGSTGSGKSWSLARLIEGAAELKSKIILFDATGEYLNLERNVQHVLLGNNPKPAKGAREVAVPYFHLMESDLFAIFNPTGQSQAPKLRAAMKSLKLARLAPNLAPDGTIVKADRSKVQFEKEYRAHIAELEDPYASFDITKLARQIENECVNPQRSAVEPLVWGGHNSGDYSHCVPLVNRIQDIVASPNLASIFNPKDKRSLFNEIAAFYRDNACCVLRVCLKHLSFEYNSREILLNAIGRYLLEMARKEYFRKRPLLVVLDEAHQFLNARLQGQSSNFPLDSFALIAKEGRKYAITLCLATQRPRDIPEGVMSQMGTLIAHRLINADDRAVIEKAAAELDASTAAAIPSMPPGDAIVMGVDFPIPMSITVEPPTAKPDSRGPDYQGCWR